MGSLRSQKITVPHFICFGKVTQKPVYGMETYIDGQFFYKSIIKATIWLSLAEMTKALNLKQKLSSLSLYLVLNLYSNKKQEREP